MWIWLTLFFVGSTYAQVLVNLPQGPIQGKMGRTFEGRSYLTFEGIPLGEPPVGKLRFKPPVPAKKWTETIVLPKSLDRCYQMNSNSPTENEDCLYIYVWTPILNAKTNKTRLPVVLNYYGGGFRNGGVGNFKPNYWVQNDVVIAAANYRVGAFGFVSSGDMVLPGNAGLKDQQLAIKWINENIHLFGGDNRKLTIKGQSAGGASVGYQVLSPKNKGLFRAAIAESGSPLDTFSYNPRPLAYMIQLSQQINSSVPATWSAAQYLEFLQSVPAKDIDTAHGIIKVQPVAIVEPEHDEAFITKSMFTSFENGDYNQVPMILGINSEERITLVQKLGSVAKAASQADADYSKNLPEIYFLKNESQKNEAGKFIHDVYAGKDDTLHNHLGRYVGWASDNRFTRGVIKQGQLMSKHTPVYFYIFSYKGPTGGKMAYKNAIAEADDVAHAEELGYFDKNRATMTPEDALTQDRLLSLWLTFIKELNPTPKKLPLLNNLIWPKVEPDNYQYLNINVTLSIEKQPKGKYFLGWESLFETYMKKPFVTF